jgi:hypothetical protein
MDISQEEFDDLLKWLDDDRDRAGEVYNDIHRQLTDAFRRWGLQEPEESASETVNRVAKKVKIIAPDYVGEKIKYFFATARFVLLEKQRVPPSSVLPDDNLLPAPEPVPSNPSLDCLEHCLAKLTESSRNLILRFYSGEKRVKIENRRKLAEEMKIDIAYLRLQAHRVRTVLKKCILDCLAAENA